MFLEQAKQFLINAHMVTNQQPLMGNLDLKKNSNFEFVFDEQLKILECLEIIPAKSTCRSVSNYIKEISNLHRVLFELNHVRVNPKLDNHHIISMLTNTLSEVGIRINNQPSENSLAICFKPLGDLVDNVRFYLKENNSIVFLSTNRPKLSLVR